MKSATKVIIIIKINYEILQSIACDILRTNCLFDPKQCDKVNGDDSTRSKHSVCCLLSIKSEKKEPKRNVNEVKLDILNEYFVELIIIKKKQFSLGLFTIFAFINNAIQALKSFILDSKKKNLFKNNL